MNPDLQDLVLQNSSQRSEEDPSPLEILQNPVRLAPGVLAEKIEEALQIITKDRSRSSEICARLLAWIVCSDGNWYTPSSPLSLLARTQQALPLLLQAEEAEADEEAHTFVTEYLKKMHRCLIEEERLARRRASVGNFASSLQYLVSLWGSDAEAQLEQITDTRRSTIKRWIRNSGGAQSFNERRVRNAAAIFYQLLEEEGWSKEEAFAWWEEKLPDGQSPAQAIQSSWSTPRAIYNSLHERGIFL